MLRRVKNPRMKLSLLCIIMPSCFISAASEVLRRITILGWTRALLCGGLIFMSAAVAGCLGEDKQTSLQVRLAELEAGKQYLSEEIKKLQLENTKLKHELANAKKELADLSTHTQKVRQLNSALRNDAQALRSAFERLKADHEKLLIENIELKKELKERGRPATVASVVGPRKQQGRSSEKHPPNNEERRGTACDAIVQLIQRCEAVMKNYRGDERRQKLRTLRAQFLDLTKSAPTDATQALDAWLADLSRLSTDPLDAAMFPLFVRKNAILKACTRTE